MKPTIKWVNVQKPRKTLSIIGNKPDTVYPAHSIETPGFSPYVNKSAYDYAVECIKMIQKTKNAEHASDWLKENGELD